MSAKTSAARRAAFFAALRATGNQTLAAERAKVSRSWVSLHRADDPAFRAELDAAIATAKQRLRASGAVAPGKGWGNQAGEELTVRGSNGRRVQVARARVRQWTPRVEARFLTELGAGCNVKAACATVGLSQASAYKHRDRWPDFADRWRDTLIAGYERIEGAVHDSAGRLFGRVEADEDAPIPPMTVDQALQLLAMYRKTIHGGGYPAGRWRMPKLPPQAEVDRALSRLLDRHDRDKARAAARRARRAGAVDP